MYSILEFQIYSAAALLPREGLFGPCALSVLSPAPSMLARALPLLPRAPPQPPSPLLLSCAPLLFPFK